MSEIRAVMCAKLGHNFEPRYNYGPAPFAIEPSFLWGSPDNAKDILETAQPKTYLFDICTRCGAKITTSN